jgi:hypothetical protein
MPRFVILEHDCADLHFDFMLEAGNVLRTWRLSMPPQVGRSVAAQLSFDHRLIYLDYEGPISGDRGSVLRWDGGNFIWKIDSEKRIAIEVTGDKCVGSIEIIRLSQDQWELTWKAEDPA